jgi:hypothetical protein
MTDFAKLDKTVAELESQAEAFKQHNKVLAKVSEMSLSIEKGVSELTQSNKNFDGLKTEIQKSIKGLNSEVENLTKENVKQVDKLIEFNKNFVRDLEGTLSSKLERFSSDIQVTIRQERSQLQESIQNNLVTQFNNQKQEFEKQNIQLRLLKNILIGLVLLSIGIAIGIFIK